MNSQNIPHTLHLPSSYGVPFLSYLKERSRKILKVHSSGVINPEQYVPTCYIYINNSTISMGYCKKDLTPLLTH